MPLSIANKLVGLKIIQNISNLFFLWNLLKIINIDNTNSTTTATKSLKDTASEIKCHFDDIVKQVTVEKIGSQLSILATNDMHDIVNFDEQILQLQNKIIEKTENLRTYVAICQNLKVSEPPVPDNSICVGDVVIGNANSRISNYGVNTHPGIVVMKDNDMLCVHYGNGDSAFEHESTYIKSNSVTAQEVADLFSPLYWKSPSSSLARELGLTEKVAQVTKWFVFQLLIFLFIQ